MALKTTDGKKGGGGGGGRGGKLTFTESSRKLSRYKSKGFEEDKVLGDMQTVVQQMMNNQPVKQQKTTRSEKSESIASSMSSRRAGKFNPFKSDFKPGDTPSRYLKQKHIWKKLSKCLSEVCEHRPADPFEFIAHWLYKSVDSEIYFYEKIVFTKECETLLLEYAKSKAKKQEMIMRINEKMKELKEGITDAKLKQSILINTTLANARLKSNPFVDTSDFTGMQLALHKIQNEKSAQLGWNQGGRIDNDSSDEDEMSVFTQRLGLNKQSMKITQAMSQSTVASSGVGSVLDDSPFGGDSDGEFNGEQIDEMGNRRQPSENWAKARKGTVRARRLGSLTGKPEKMTNFEKMQVMKTIKQRQSKESKEQNEKKAKNKNSQEKEQNEKKSQQKEQNEKKSKFKTVAKLKMAKIKDTKSTGNPKPSSAKKTKGKAISKGSTQASSRRTSMISDTSEYDGSVANSKSAPSDSLVQWSASDTAIETPVSSDPLTSSESESKSVSSTYSDESSQVSQSNSISSAIQEESSSLRITGAAARVVNIVHTENENKSTDRDNWMAELMKSRNAIKRASNMIPKVTKPQTFEQMNKQIDRELEKEEKKAAKKRMEEIKEYTRQLKEKKKHLEYVVRAEIQEHDTVEKAIKLAEKYNTNIDDIKSELSRKQKEMDLMKKDLVIIEKQLAVENTGNETLLKDLKEKQRILKRNKEDTRKTFEMLGQDLQKVILDGKALQESIVHQLAQRKRDVEKTVAKKRAELKKSVSDNVFMTNELEELQIQSQASSAKSPERYSGYSGDTGDTGYNFLLREAREELSEGLSRSNDDISALVQDIQDQSERVNRLERSVERHRASVSNIDETDHIDIGPLLQEKFRRSSTISDIKTAIKDSKEEIRRQSKILSRPSKIPKQTDEPRDDGTEADPASIRRILSRIDSAIDQVDSDYVQSQRLRARRKQEEEELVEIRRKSNLINQKLEDSKTEDEKNELRRLSAWADQSIAEHEMKLSELADGMDTLGILTGETVLAMTLGIEEQEEEIEALKEELNILGMQTPTGDDIKERNAAAQAITSQIVEKEAVLEKLKNNKRLESQKRGVLVKSKHSVLKKEEKQKLQQIKSAYVETQQNKSMIQTEQAEISEIDNELRQIKTVASITTDKTQRKALQKKEQELNEAKQAKKQSIQAIVQSSNSLKNQLASLSKEKIAIRASIIAYNVNVDEAEDDDVINPEVAKSFASKEDLTLAKEDLARVVKEKRKKQLQTSKKAISDLDNAETNEEDEELFTPKEKSAAESRRGSMRGSRSGSTRSNSPTSTETLVDEKSDGVKNNVDSKKAIKGKPQGKKPLPKKLVKAKTRLASIDAFKEASHTSKSSDSDKFLQDIALKVEGSDEILEDLNSDELVEAAQAENLESLSQLDNVVGEIGQEARQTKKPKPTPKPTSKTKVRAKPAPTTVPLKKKKIERKKHDTAEIYSPDSLDDADSTDTLPMDLPMDLNDVLSEYGGMADDGKDEEEILGEDATEEEKRESMQRQVQRQVLAVRRARAAKQRQLAAKRKQEAARKRRMSSMDSLADSPVHSDADDSDQDIATEHVEGEHVEGEHVEGDHNGSDEPSAGDDSFGGDSGAPPFIYTHDEEEDGPPSFSGDPGSPHYENECQWTLEDPMTLVCVHPLLGTIKARRYRAAQALENPRYWAQKEFDLSVFYHGEIYNTDAWASDDVILGGAKVNEFRRPSDGQLLETKPESRKTSSVKKKGEGMRKKSGP